MRNTERLVQIEMADIGAVIAGPRQSHLRVHVGAVEIDLAAMAVHDLADIADMLLEHAMGRGIGDHDRGKIFRMLFGLGAEIIDIDVARIAGDHHDLHAGHMSGGRIGAVGGGRDQAHLAMRLAAGCVIIADCEQACIFALRARIRLQRNRVIAGHVAQPFFEPREQRVIAVRLLTRRERMKRAEFGPGQRDHLGCGVELHGAGAQRNHRAVEREIAIAEFAHIAQQLGLGAMSVEHRMGEECAIALQLARQRLAHTGFDFGVVETAAEGVPYRLDHFGRRGLVQRDTKRALADCEVDFFSPRTGDDVVPLAADIHRQRVEKCFRLRRKTELAQSRRQHGRTAMHCARDVGQSLRTVIDRVH